MRILGTAAAICSAGLLAACGSAEQEEAPEPVPTVNPGPRTLVGADLDLDALGPRIEGPEGSEVESEVPGLGTVVSYVACPAEMVGGEEAARSAEAGADRASAAGDTDAAEGACDLETQPEDALYTYVHRVTLETPEGEEEDAGAQVSVFRTTLPAPGFANVIGYSREQAAEALGEDGDIRVQVDNGRLIWRVAAGDGWTPGETLTFFWQSTEPPAGPQEAYRLDSEGERGLARGPFPDEPEEEEPVEESPGA